MNKAFDIMFSKDTNEEPLFNLNLSDENTSEALYVWLPIKFNKENKPYIEYLREWKKEEM